MLRLPFSLILLFTVAGCFIAGNSYDNSFKWTDKGAFEMSCAIERPGVMQGTFVQSDDGLKSVAGTLCGGDYVLEDYTSNTYTSTGKPSRFSAKIIFSCEPTTRTLERADALDINEVCANLFLKDAA